MMTTDGNDLAREERERLEKIERARRLNIAIGRVLAGMKPPENLTVSEWAEKKRRLSSESSAEIGPYRVSRTPYLREIMDAFTDPKVRRLILVSSSQVGNNDGFRTISTDALYELPLPEFRAICNAARRFLLRSGSRRATGGAGSRSNA